MEDLKIEVGVKDDKYPYLDDKNINLTNLRGVMGRLIYLPQGLLTLILSL